MTTLATMKAEIADDLARTDLTSAIATAISRAIRFYQPHHFYFNETRSATFATVAGQIWYGADDDADIPLIVDLDAALVTVGTNNYRLKPAKIDDFLILSDGNASSGQPYLYTRYKKQIGLFNKPDQAYSVTLVGSYMTPEPADDDEEDNDWMVEAYDLIRAEAAARVYANKIKDIDEAQVQRMIAQAEFDRIMKETSRRHATNRVEAFSS